jgi:hypothetical protein
VRNRHHGIKIDKKIVGYKVPTKDEPQEARSAPAERCRPTWCTCTNQVLRPERLVGTTYKMKTPEHVSEHALYITINDIMLNEGTVTKRAARSRSSSTPRTWSTTSGLWR